jgi:hypothetical protein
VDDQSLTEVLKKHLRAREVEIDEEVRRADGSRGIVDLMFSRSIRLAGSEAREHLIVELKRPSVTINAEVVAQKDRARGILFQSAETDDLQVTIWVKTWSQIVNECRARMRFFAEKLNYTPDRDSSLLHLKATYHKYLAALFTAQDDDGEQKADEAG